MEQERRARTSEETEGCGDGSEKARGGSERENLGRVPGPVETPLAGAELGWRGEECQHSGGDRRQCRGVSRDLAALGVAEGCKEDKAGRLSFVKHLKERGLACPRLITSDKCLGLLEGMAGGFAEVFPEAAWRRCTVHWYRNIFTRVPREKARGRGGDAEGDPCPGKP